MEVPATDAGSPDHPWVAASLDLVMWPLKRLRAKVVPQATGRVIEVGVGTGMNFAEYGDIESLYGVEPDPHMLRRARAKAEGLKFPVALEQVGAEEIPREDSSFDTAVVTWVLCTIPEPERALTEIFRVLRPGGRMLYAEHTRARGPLAARFQDRLTPLWRKLAGGCHLNRDSVAMIRDSGFSRVSCRPAGSEDWTLLPVYRGVAQKDA